MKTGAAANAILLAPSDTLRGYQRRERRDIERALARFRRVLFVAFMGSGKTVVAASLVRTWVAQGSRVLILVHRGEILKQTARKLQGAGVHASAIGYIWAHDKRMNADAPVQLASVQTLVRRDAPEGITHILIDEAHHVQAGSWRNILSWYPKAKVLGLTATPERLDGKPLREFFDEMVLGEPPEALIEDEWLTQPEIWTREDGWRPKGLRKIGGDYAPKAAARAMSRSTIVGGIPKAYLKHAHGMPAVGFAATKEQALGLVKACRRDGVASEPLFDSNTEREREAILSRLKKGATRIVWTCDILGEGWDYPGARCVILARPTASLARYMQWSGRCMRPGARAVVLDHAGNFYRHGPPWEERDWSIDGNPGSTRLTPKTDAFGRVTFVAPIEVDGRLVRADSIICPTRCETCRGPVNRIAAWVAAKEHRDIRCRTCVHKDRATESEWGRCTTCEKRVTPGAAQTAKRLRRRTLCKECRQSERMGKRLFCTVCGKRMSHRCSSRPKALTPVCRPCRTRAWAKKIRAKGEPISVAERVKRSWLTRRRRYGESGRSK